MGGEIMKDNFIIVTGDSSGKESTWRKICTRVSKGIKL